MTDGEDDRKGNEPDERFGYRPAPDRPKRPDVIEGYDPPPSPPEPVTEPEPTPNSEPAEPDGGTEK